MIYPKTIWVDSSTPLSAGNMNNIENQLESLFQLLFRTNREAGTSMVESVSRSGYHVGKYLKFVTGSANAVFDSLATLPAVFINSTAMGIMANSIDGIIEIFASSYAEEILLTNVSTFNSLANTFKATIDANPTRIGSTPVVSKDQSPSGTVTGTLAQWTWVETLLDSNSSYDFTSCTHNLTGVSMGLVLPTGSANLTVQKFAIGGVKTTLSNATATSMGLNGTIYTILIP